MTPKKGLLERLSDGVVIGDGGFVHALEKRGYVKAGPWTPEATVENPDGVRQLHREFLMAGSNVMQAFTFYATDDKLGSRGNEAKRYTARSINDAACRIAREVADEGDGDALVAGGISQTPSYISGADKEFTQNEFKKQVQVFMENGVDFLIAEYFEHVEEMEWAIEEMVKSGLPILSTMCIGPLGDMHGVDVGECAVRMARKGAHGVGVNCHFDPFIALEALKRMKDALKRENLTEIHLVAQPLGLHTPDAGKQGFIDLPEFPFALEPRILTRWDMQKYAREAFELGVRYIGGCCGVEPYHIRAVSEELREEIGKLPKSSEKHELWGGAMTMAAWPFLRVRARREYWESLKPATGRPFNPSMSTPDNWGLKAGDSTVTLNIPGESKEDEIKRLLAYRDSMKMSK